MFAVAVAADIFSVKTNFELTFPSRPSLVDLVRQTEIAFSNEIALRRPEAVPQHGFHVSKFKLYDEDRNKWVDLLSEGQLVANCQMYAFQPENPWHKESQKEIPPAVRPPAGVVVTQQQRMAARQPSAMSVTATPPPAQLMARPASQTQPSAPPRVNVNASDDEKLRIVFAEFDLKGNRMVDMEDLKQGFRTLGLEFTAATMNDLFQKGDANHDGRISYSEFERFAKLYPIMMDCLFYRSKAFWDEENLTREIQQEKESVRLALQNVQNSQNAVLLAQRSIEEANDTIMNAEADLKERNSRLRDVAKEIDNAQRDKDRLQKERYDREGELSTQRDRERQARQAHQDIVRELDKLDRRCTALQQDFVKADDRVKQLQQQLTDAQRAAERAAQLAKQCTTECETMRIKERDAQRLTESILRDLPRAEDSLRDAEANVAAAISRIKELEQLTRDLGREVDEANRRRDAGERAAVAARDQEMHLSAELERVRRVAEERDRQAKAREAELLEQQRQRQLITQHERALIEQELRLREQRDTLEEKEVKLKTEASSFLGSLRQNITRSYSRDPSAAAGDYRASSSTGF